MSNISKSSTACADTFFMDSALDRHGNPRKLLELKGGLCAIFEHTMMATGQKVKVRGPPRKSEEEARADLGGVQLALWRQLLEEGEEGTANLKSQGCVVSWRKVTRDQRKMWQREK